MKHLTLTQAAALKFGDELRFMDWPGLGCTFKFRGHDGALIVTLSEATHAAWSGPIDRIVRQRALALPEAEAC